MGVAAARPHPECGVVSPRAPLVKIVRNHYWVKGIPYSANSMCKSELRKFVFCT